MKQYMDFLIRGAQERTREFLHGQCRDSGTPGYGGKESPVLEAKPTIYDMATALSVYFLPQSLYYQDPSLWESLCLAMDFVERIQRRDGSFDFPSCNFFSAADTAFCFKRLLLGYDLLERFGQKEHKTLQERYRQVMRRAQKIEICKNFY